MTIEFGISGFLELTICTLNTDIPVDNETGLGVMDNLQQGEYTIGIRDSTICDINNLSEPLYSFILEPTNNVEYEFEEF